jgi:hypothetical protein
MVVRLGVNAATGGFVRPAANYFRVPTSRCRSRCAIYVSGGRRRTDVNIDELLRSIVSCSAVSTGIAGCSAALGAAIRRRDIAPDIAPWASV